MSEVDEAEPVEYRVRRQRRSTVTIIVLLLVLAGAFYYASSYFRDSTPKAGPCSTESVTTPLRASQVTVNVYNATSRKGLALSTSKVVAQRGFKIKTVGNDPLKKAVTQVAQIRYGADGEAGAKLLAQHLPGAVLQQDQRTGDEIDLAIGAAFKQFGPAPTTTAQTNTLRPCPTVTVSG